MFTGIVEEIGKVMQIGDVGDQHYEMSITCRKVLVGTKLGDSIAINGTCLTVTTLAQDGFTAGLSPETLRRTNLGQLSHGSPVNLERSIQAGGRMGGHYVQGHIDGTGTITDITAEGDSLRVTIEPEQRMMRYIVEKGYVAIDGTSLTIAARTQTDFTIALIAYTQDAVILGQQKSGTAVNIEVDILAKYVEQLVGGNVNGTHNG
ncbi:MAG: riboflavin synthase [Herpetosiphon sp.]